MIALETNQKYYTTSELKTWVILTTRLAGWCNLPDECCRMDTGVMEITEGRDSFRIFATEKTIIDIIYYRNKIGIEETSKALRNHLKSQDRQIDRHYAYAKMLRFESIVRTYLEVLV